MLLRSGLRDDANRPEDLVPLIVRRQPVQEPQAVALTHQDVPIRREPPVLERLPDLHPLTSMWLVLIGS